MFRAQCGRRVTPFRVRQGTARDIGQLVAFRAAMDRELGGLSEPVALRERARYRRWLRDRMRRRLVVPFLAETRAREPVAGAIVWLREVPPRPGRTVKRIPRIHAVYTRPEFRRRGAAALVVGAAVRWARQHGYPQVALRTTDAARPLYEKLGFRPVPEMILQLDSPARSRRGRPSGSRRTWSSSRSDRRGEARTGAHRPSNERHRPPAIEKVRPSLYRETGA